MKAGNKYFVPVSNYRRGFFFFSSGLFMMKLNLHAGHLDMEKAYKYLRSLSKWSSKTTSNVNSVRISAWCSTTASTWRHDCVLSPSWSCFHVWRYRLAGCLERSGLNWEQGTDLSRFKYQISKVTLRRGECQRWEEIFFPPLFQICLTCIGCSWYVVCH